MQDRPNDFLSADPENNISQAAAAEDNPAARPPEQMLSGTAEAGSPAAPALTPAAELPAKKQRSGWRMALSIGGNVLFFCLLAMMVALVFSLVQSRLRGGPPQVAGHQMYIVLSGSMSPAFEAGSLAFVQPVNPRNIGEGDIITFHCASG